MTRRLWGDEDNPYSGDIDGYDSSVDMWAIGVTVYALLSGTLPFRGKPKALRKLIVEEDPAFPKAKWHAISLEAKSFILNLLQKDPSMRPNASKSRDHPFIANDGRRRKSESASAVLSRKTEIVDAFQGFRKADLLQKLALELMAFSTPPKKLQDLRALFRKVGPEQSTQAHGAPHDCLCTTPCLAVCAPYLSYLSPISPYLIYPSHTALAAYVDGHGRLRYIVARRVHRSDGDAHGAR